MENALENTWFYTADGSLSQTHAETGEAYHNHAGAYTEALETYVKPSSGVETLLQTGRLSVLDACFGLGYNTWVLLAACLKALQTLHQSGSLQRYAPLPFYTIQVVAIETDFLRWLDLPVILRQPIFNDLKNILTHLEHNIYYQTLISEGVFSTHVINRGDFSPPTSSRFSSFSAPNLPKNLRLSFTFYAQDLRQLLPRLAPEMPVGCVFDCVFHDPFSPAKVPELWTQDLFAQYNHLLAPKTGRVLTYSSAVAVRAGLQHAGFQVYERSGIGQKATTTVASKQALAPEMLSTLNIYPLPPQVEALLLTRSGLPYRDPALCALRTEILHWRQQAQAQSNRPGREAVNL